MWKIWNNFFLSDLLSYRAIREEDQKQNPKEITKEIEQKISELWEKTGKCYPGNKGRIPRGT